MGLPSVKVSERAGIRPFGLTDTFSASAYLRVVKVDLTIQEPLLLLSVLGDIDLREIIWKTRTWSTLSWSLVPIWLSPKLLQSDGDLDAVRRLWDRSAESHLLDMAGLTWVV